MTDTNETIAFLITTLRTVFARGRREDPLGCSPGWGKKPPPPYSDSIPAIWHIHSGTTGSPSKKSIPTPRV